MKGRLPREEWPAVLQGHPLVKGVFIGGCVCRGVGSSFRARAHAHTGRCCGGWRHTGWICIRAEARLADEQLLRHELAHILTGEGHTDTWRAKLLELGGVVEGRYVKQPRRFSPYFCLRCRAWHPSPRRCAGIIAKPGSQVAAGPAE